MARPRKRILVCGASGFLGYSIFQALEKQKQFLVKGTYFTNRYNRINTNDPRFFKADLTDKRQVADIGKGFDIIIQAAANSSGAKDVVERPYLHVTDNAVINALMFQEAHDSKVPHVIFPSCTVMYPSSRKQSREIDVDLNKEFYHKYFGGAWMKIYAEKLAEFYSRLGRTSYTIIRHSNMYGPNDRFDAERSHVTAATIRKVMAETGNTITVWGKGTEERDLLYIDDLVQFVQLVIKKHNQRSPFDIFNVGLGKVHSVAEIVQKVINASGKKLAINYDTSKPTIATRIAIDTSKAKKAFNWKPRYTLDQGLKKTIDWYKQNIS